MHAKYLFTIPVGLQREFDATYLISRVIFKDGLGVKITPQFFRGAL